MLVKIDLCGTDWYSISVYNTAGERVRVLKHGGPGDAYSSGEQSLLWEGKNDHGEWVASGLYILHGESGRFADDRLVVVVR